MNQISSLTPDQSLQLRRQIRAEKCRRSFSYFVQTIWHTIIPEKMVWNWHMDYICDTLQETVKRVAARKPKKHNIVINVPPGTSKSTIVSEALPIWAWVKDPSIRSICSSYAHPLALDLALRSRDILLSDTFREMFPEIELREDQREKSHFQNTSRGERFTTSTGGSVTGMHGHLLIMDDPINPNDADSWTKEKLNATNNWVANTFLSRKVDNEVSVCVLVQQRLTEEDTSNWFLERSKDSVRHISLPAELGKGAEVKPAKLKKRYKDGLLDPVRLNRKVLDEKYRELGSRVYAAQYDQSPRSRDGSLFRPSQIELVNNPPSELEEAVRYWDKAGTDRRKNPNAAATAGVKLARMRDGRFCILHVKRGMWEASDRESVIKQTAHTDGRAVAVYVEQEPGSGGKESAQNTIQNLAGYVIKADRPTGSKEVRAEPVSVQVNQGMVCMVKGEWNQEFIDELETYPYGKRKDQADAFAGAFNKMTIKEKKKKAGAW